MNPRSVYPREDVYTNLWRHIESPSIRGFLKSVEYCFQFAILWSEFKTEIRLEHSFPIHGVASGHPERQLKERVLLVGIQ